MNLDLRNKCINIVKTNKIRFAKKALNYIPYQTFMTVYDIDYNKLYSEGKRYILFDLDNTLCPYDRNKITPEEIDLFKKLDEIGFKYAIISNNTKDRILDYLDGTSCLFSHYSLKPRLVGYKRLHKAFGYPNKNEIVTIGDQMMTDCYGGNKFDIDVILVKSIKRSNEKWYTVINRKRSKKILNKIKSIDEVTYLEIKKVDDK